MTSNELGQRAHRLERQGEWEEAGACYSRLFRCGIEERNLRVVADALRGGTRVRHQQGRFEEAIELAELSWYVAEQAGLPRETARAINALAVVYHLQRDWSRAGALYRDALERALELGDDVLVGETCVNLGVLANVRGELREARVRYLESVGSSVRSENKVNAMMAYNNLGMVCADLQEWMEAEVYFDRGIEIAERLSSAPLLAKLYANRAEPLIQVGELARAGESLDRAHAMAAQTGDRGTLADVARFRGMIARRRGDLASAEELLAEAVSVASAGGLELELAEALRELGRLRREQGREEDARAVLAEAGAKFRSIGALRDAERVEEFLAEQAGR